LRSARGWPREVFCKRSEQKWAWYCEYERALLSLSLVKTKSLEEATKLGIDDPPPNACLAEDWMGAVFTEPVTSTTMKVVGFTGPNGRCSSFGDKDCTIVMVAPVNPIDGPAIPLSRRLFKKVKMGDVFTETITRIPR
jgi:hypothetical protein